MHGFHGGRRKAPVSGIDRVAIYGTYDNFFNECPELLRFFQIVSERSDVLVAIDLREYLGQRMLLEKKAGQSRTLKALLEVTDVSEWNDPIHIDEEVDPLLFWLNQLNNAIFRNYAFNHCCDDEL